MARRDTRELILTTSLELFNTLGEPNVSTNEIALEAEISPGNLYYHFHNRDDIALELFKRYLLEVSPLLEPADETPALEDITLRLHLLFETMGRYRFIYRDLADLYARVDNLRQAMNGLLGRMETALHRLVGRLRDDGLMAIGRQDEEALVANALVQMTFWIAYAQVRDAKGLDDGSALAAAAARVLQLFVPYLVEPAADGFRTLALAYLEPQNHG